MPRDMFSSPRALYAPELRMKVLAGTLPLVSAAVAERPLPPPVRVARPAPPPDEATLCERAMTGDRDAWNALVQRHNHRVVVALLARGVRIDRAKDIAQEAWMRLVEQQRAGRLTHLQLPGLAIAQAAFLSLEAARRDASRGEPLSIHGDAEREAIDLADPAADAE